MAVNVTTTTEDGATVYEVDPNGETDFTLATAGTYVANNINFKINGLTATIEDITGSDNKCLTFTQS